MCVTMTAPRTADSKVHGTCFILAVLSYKPRALCILDKLSTTGTNTVLPRHLYHMWCPVMHRSISGLSRLDIHHLPTLSSREAVLTTGQLAGIVFGPQVLLTLFFVYIYLPSVYVCTCVCKYKSHGSHAKVRG